VPLEVLRFTTVKQFVGYAMKNGADLWVGGGGHYRLEKEGQHDTWTCTGSKQLHTSVRKSMIKYLQRANLIETTESKEESKDKYDGNVLKLLTLLEASYDDTKKLIDEKERFKKERDEALSLKKKAIEEKLQLQTKQALEMEALRCHLNVARVEHDRREAETFKAKTTKQLRDYEKSDAKLKKQISALTVDNSMYKQLLENQKAKIDMAEELEKSLNIAHSTIEEQQNSLLEAKAQLDRLPQLRVAQMVDNVLIPLKEQQMQIMGMQYNIFIDLKEAQQQLITMRSSQGDTTGSQPDSKAPSLSLFQFAKHFYETMRYRFFLGGWNLCVENLSKAELGSAAGPHFWKETDPELVGIMLKQLHFAVRAAVLLYESNLKQKPTTHVKSVLDEDHHNNRRHHHHHNNHNNMPRKNRSALW